MITFKTFLKEFHLAEGKMKRSDPYISGDSETPTYKVPAPIKKLSPLEKRLTDMASRANVTLKAVEKLWNFYDRGVDASLPNRYGIITNKVKKSLGLSV